MKQLQIVSFNTANDRVQTFEGSDEKGVIAEAYIDYVNLYRALEETGELECFCNFLSLEEFLSNDTPAIVSRSVNDYVIYTKNWIEIPKNFYVDLDNDMRMCAWANEEDGYREIQIHLEKNGEILQDLAIVGQDYVYKEDKIALIPNRYAVKVYADKDNEAFTDEFLIEGLNDGKTWKKLCDDAENDDKYAIKAKDNARAQLRAIILAVKQYDIENYVSPEDEIENFLDEWGYKIYFDDKGNIKEIEQR